MRILVPGASKVFKQEAMFSWPTVVHGLVVEAPYGTSVAAPDQAFLPGAPASRVADDPVFGDFENGAGVDVSVGTAVFWRISPLRRQVAELATLMNQYDPAGVVVRSTVEDGGIGKLCRRGVVNTYVLGQAGLAAGTPLEPVPGQVYLRKATNFSTLQPGTYFSFVLLENHVTASSQLKRVRVKCEY